MQILLGVQAVLWIIIPLLLLCFVIPLLKVVVILIKQNFCKTLPRAFILRNYTQNLKAFVKYYCNVFYRMRVILIPLYRIVVRSVFC